MRLPKFALVLSLVCCAFLAGRPAAGQTAAPDDAKARVLRVAAAADLQPVMPAFAQAFEKETGIKLVVTIGSSGTLATQILNGAPIDIFLGADFSFPEKIVAAGMADMSAPEPYAKGTLVLWARKDMAISPLSLDLVTDPRIKAIAIANELHAPFGRAAVATLQKMKVYDTVKPKLVVAENVAQTGQFIESGNAQIGFISLTLASSEHFKQIGNYVLAPFVYPEIRQCAVVLKGSTYNADAHVFLKWLLSKQVQEHLRDFGLTPVR